MMTGITGPHSVRPFESVGPFEREGGAFFCLKRLFAGLLAVLLLGAGAPRLVPAQERPAQPRIGSPIVLTDDAGGRQVLEVGIDPNATDGVDSDFGEGRAPLPPPNFTTVFATLVDDNVDGVDQFPNEGMKVDIRQGQEGFTGQKLHEIDLGFDPDVISQITFRWDLPSGVTGTLDVIGGPSFNMEGSGSATVEELVTSLGTPIPRAEVTLDYDGSQKRTLRNVIPGEGGTGNDTGWRLLAPPTGSVRGDLQDDLNFDVDSGHMLHTWAGGGPDAWSPATSASDPLERGEGFVLYIFDDEKDEITGSGRTLDLSNEGEDQGQDVEVGLDKNNRFHVLGNPYNVSYGLSGLAGGNLQGQGFQETMQVWNPDQQKFEPRIPGDGKGPIDPWEGFVVQRTTPGQGASSITFSTSGKQSSSVNSASSEAGAVVASGQEAGNPRAAVRLEVSTGEDGGQGSATVFLGEEATAGWDAYDATRIAPPGGAAVAAALPTMRGEDVVQRVMGSLPYPPEEEARSLPLSVKAAPGQSVTVRWPEAARDQVPDNWTVELEDRKTDARTDLRGGGYAFEVSEDGAGLSGPEDARFLVHAGPATAVPVEMTALEASVAGEGEGPERNAVRLTWQTASEQNNAGFYVQRKSTSEEGGSGGHWQRLGFVESKAGGGTTSEPQSYRFTDRELPYGANKLSYRLRQVDTDGTAHLTEAVTLTLGAPKEAKLGAPVPNPASRQATVRFAVPTATEVQIGLYDLLGRQVATLAEGRREAGHHEVSLPVGALSPGLYLVRMQAGQKAHTRKLTVVR